MIMRRHCQHKSLAVALQLKKLLGILLSVLEAYLLTLPAVADGLTSYLREHYKAATAGWIADQHSENWHVVFH
jgi:hypothetical protein